jgi:hypothetical protein
MPRKKEEEAAQKAQEEVDGYRKFFNFVTNMLFLIFICMIWAIIPIFIIHHVFLFYLHEMLFIIIKVINNAKLPGKFAIKDFFYSDCYDSIRDYPEICKVIRDIYNKNINTFIDIVNELIPNIIKTNIGEITANTIENVINNFNIIGQSFGKQEKLQNIIHKCPSIFATFMQQLPPTIEIETLIQTQIDDIVNPLNANRLGPVSYKGGNAKQLHSIHKNNTTNKTFLQFSI